MGVIHKLKPEIRDFIIEQKKAKLNLSCRRLSSLIEDKFQAEVSKSSINSIIKEAGLSLPAGRRSKRKEVKLLEVKPARENEITGAILLKSADYLIGGSNIFVEVIKKHLTRKIQNLKEKTEFFLYRPLFAPSKDAQNSELSGLWALIGQEIPTDSLATYLDDLQMVRTINLDIIKALPELLKEGKYIKIDMSDNSQVYIDGQLYTVWPDANIPIDLCSTICNAEGQINRSFVDAEPLVLFAAPEAAAPTKEFFDFIEGFNAKEKQLRKVSLHGRDADELKSFNLSEPKKRSFILGLWPWQFVRYRKVRKIGDFRQFFFAPQNKEYFIADAEVVLLQPDTKQQVKIRGCALKTSISDKISLIIMSNLEVEEASAEQLAMLYLNRWPNLTEAFKDFIRKNELSYYGLSSNMAYPASLGLSKDASQSIKSLFNHYLRALDLFARWQFMPASLQNMDFPTIKEAIYDLAAVFEKKEAHTVITFRLTEGFKYARELEFACRRLNQREIRLSDGTRLWFHTPGV